MDAFPSIRLITPDIIDRLVNESINDGQPIVSPTHVIMLNGDIVGSMQLGNFPMMGLWLHTDRLKHKPRESFMLIQSAENIMAGLGFKDVYFPLMPSSPFNDLQEHMGYTKLGESIIYHKKVR